MPKTISDRKYMTEKHPQYQEILKHFYSVGRTLRQCSVDADAEVHELTLHQMQALFYIKDHRRIMMSELASELHISAAALSTLVDRLVTTGWLERSRDEHDRRIVYLELSGDSRHRLNKIADRKMDHMTQLFDHLNATELSELLHILQRLDGAIDKTNTRKEA